MSLLLNARDVEEYWAMVDLKSVLNATINEANLATKLKENLLDLSSDGMLQLEFKFVNLDTFWLKRKSEYTTIEALKCWIPFATSYLCELTFSSMAQIKSKERNRLILENDLILNVAKTDPRWEKLVTMKNKRNLRIKSSHKFFFS